MNCAEFIRRVVGNSFVLVICLATCGTALGITLSSEKVDLLKSKSITRVSEVGIVSVIARDAGPYVVGQVVPLEIRVRNNRGLHANIAVAVLNRNSKKFKVVSKSELVKTGQTVIFDLNVVLLASEIHEDTYRAKIVLVDTTVPKAHSVSAHFWKDYNLGNNSKIINWKIDSRGMYDVRADLIRIHFFSICNDDRSKLEKINVLVRGFVTSKLVFTASNATLKPVIIKNSNPAKASWPGPDKWYEPVKGGQIVRPKLTFYFNNVSDTQFLYLYANVAIGARKFGLFSQKTLPGSAIGTLQSSQWKKGGIISFISARADAANTKSSCPSNGTYTVVWRLEVKSAKIRTPQKKKTGYIEKKIEGKSSHK